MARTAQEIISQEVLCTFSNIIQPMAQAYGEKLPESIGGMVEQAFELCSPIPDYEEAARQAGWARFNDVVSSFFANVGTGGRFFGDSWRALCEEFDIGPYEQEVFEHWAVTEWFGRKLEAKGEKVDFDFQGLCIWARTTTGQAIYADCVVEEIAADLAKPEVA